MKRIYCIIGRTGAGKDTVTDILCRMTEIPKIVSYTDAPIRSDQKNGREHWFISKDEMTKLLENEDILAETTINGNRYCTTASQLKGKNFYIIDPKGYEDLEKRTDVELTPIVITAPKAVRRKRSEKRKNFNFMARDISESPEFDSFFERKDLLKRADLNGHNSFFANENSPEKCAEKIAESLNIL